MSLFSKARDWFVGPPLTSKKDIAPWRASQHDRDNFITNRVTVSDYLETVQPKNDIGLAATWACVNLIGGTIGSLSCEVYRRIDGVKQVQVDHPLYGVLHDDPNFDLTALDFWEYMAAAIELHGNAFAYVERRNGRVVSLDPIAPNLMTVRQSSGGALIYTWTKRGQSFERRETDMLHIRGPLATPLGGLSTLTACRHVFAGVRNADIAAGKLFQNSVLPSGILSTDRVLTPEQRKTAEALLQEKFVGSVNAGRPMLLDNDLKWEQLTISPEDAQMLDTRKFGGEEICRLFGVPPAMVGYGDKASNWGTGKEVDVLGFQKFTLRRRLKRIEKAVAKQLLTRNERAQGYRIGFNFEDLLRGDSAARADFYEKLIRMGVMTRNEARALEGWSPVEGGDVITVQMQDVPLRSSEIDDED